MDGRRANFHKDQEKKNLAQRLESLAESRQQMFLLTKKKDELNLSRADVVLQHHRLTEAIRRAYKLVLDAQVRVIEAGSDLRGLKAKNANISRMLEEERKRAEELAVRVTRLKDEATAVLAEAEATIPEDPHRRAELQELGNGKTVQDIDNDIAAEKAKLELVHGVDPSIIREFEKRSRDMDRLKRDKAERQQALELIEEKIKEIRDAWEPQLDDLIGHINDAFSYNFEQINCAGEVGVHKDDEFDKWAIEIKVKFRYVSSPPPRRKNRLLKAPLPT